MEPVEPVPQTTTEPPPLQRAVVVVPRRPRWLLGAIAATTAATITASAALFVLMHREQPVVEPEEEVRVVALGVYPTPDRACAHPYLQYTVWRYRNPQTATLEIVDPFGVPTRITCIDATDATYRVSRWAGPDKTFGTVDDSCWSVMAPCDIGALSKAEVDDLTSKLKPKQPQQKSKQPKQQKQQKQPKQSKPATEQQAP